MVFLHWYPPYPFLCDLLVHNLSYSPILAVNCGNFYFREREKAMVQAGAPLIQPQNPDKARFTGGGFNLKQPQTKVA